MKKILVVVVGLTLILSLVGCGGGGEVKNLVHITGRVVDQDGQGIEDITVSCNRDRDDTNPFGKYYLSFYLEKSEYITFTIDARNYNGKKFNKTVKVYPDRDMDLGSHQLFLRDKALIKGTVSMPSTDSNNISTLSGGMRPNLMTSRHASYAEGEIIVRITESTSLDSFKSNITDIGLDLIDSTPSGRFVVVRTDNSIQASINELSTMREVKYAEPNYYVYSQSRSNSDYERNKDESWNLNAINMPNVDARYDIDCSDTYIAVLDTGIQEDYAAICSNILTYLGYDYVDDDKDPLVYTSSHGTKVASIINSVTYESANIIPLRILRTVEDDTAQGNIFALLEALEYAIRDIGPTVDIINLSVAINTPDHEIESVKEVIGWAEDVGITVISAAGNESKDSPEYPASDPRVISVGAVGPTLRPASYTNRGVDIYAPGGDFELYPAGVGNTIYTEAGWTEGTSIASAHVAGVTAMLLSNDITLEPNDIRNRFGKTSLLAAYEENTGLIDAFRALEDLEHGRILVAVGSEEFGELDYLEKESTYTYYKNVDDDNLYENHFEIANIEPGDRWIMAWVDKDANGSLSENDLFVKEMRYDIEGGDVIEEIELELEEYHF